ncbi:MAG: hypothetical protein QMD00_01605 [Hadesarchaea archaeon]|nr:hypothetical protein [Hadesarchaea archaeon]
MNDWVLFHSWEINNDENFCAQRYQLEPRVLPKLEANACRLGGRLAQRHVVFDVVVVDLDSVEPNLSRLEALEAPHRLDPHPGGLDLPFHQVSFAHTFAPVDWSMFTIAPAQSLMARPSVGGEVVGD